MRNKPAIGADRLDRLSLISMILLGVWLGVLVATLDTVSAYGSRGRHTGAALPQAQASPEYTAKIKIAKQLLTAGNMDKLKPLLDELIAGYPYQSESFMLLADYHIRKQESIDAMHAYRQALDLNLDYLEKKSPQYQGKKIKNIVAEAEQEIISGLASSPHVIAMKANRKELYYMKRKLAGGCGD